MEAEPRAQRQIIANLRRERAGMILGEMSVPQLADLLSVLAARQQDGIACSWSPRSRRGGSRPSSRERRGDGRGDDVGQLRHHVQGNPGRRGDRACCARRTSTTT